MSIKKFGKLSAIITSNISYDFSLLPVFQLHRCYIFRYCPLVIGHSVLFLSFFLFLHFSLGTFYSSLFRFTVSFLGHFEFTDKKIKYHQMHSSFLLPYFFISSIPIGFILRILYLCLCYRCGLACFLFYFNWSPYYVIHNYFKFPD